MSIPEMFTIILMIILFGCIFLDYWYKGSMILGGLLMVVVTIIWFTCSFGLAGPSEYYDGSICEGEYGYIGNSIYTPGGTYWKFPWVNVIKYKSTYDTYTIRVPTKTSDGMGIMCVIHYVHVKFNPIAFRDVYELNTKNLEKQAYDAAKPVLDRYYMDIDEHDYETGAYSDEELKQQLMKVLPVTGLKFEDGIPTPFAVTTYNTDNPKGDYFDYDKYGSYVNS
jgi:hypothetical protein